MGTVLVTHLLPCSWDFACPLISYKDLIAVGICSLLATWQRDSVTDPINGSFGTFSVPSQYDEDAAEILFAARSNRCFDRPALRYSSLHVPKG